MVTHLQMYMGGSIWLLPFCDCLTGGASHTGMCLSVYSSCPSFSSNVGSASSESSCNTTT